MPFLDKNGTELSANNHVIILGHVSGIDDNVASVFLTRQGIELELTFLRNEPVTATFEEDKVSGTINGSNVVSDSDVLIPGVVTALAGGIHDIANVEVLRNGVNETLTFYCSEVILATIDGNEISGQLVGPGKAA